MKLFSELLIVFLLLRNIRCGVTRNKRFLNYFMGSKTTTTPKTIDFVIPSEEYYKTLDEYQNPKFVRVYKVPSAVESPKERNNPDLTSSPSKKSTEIFEINERFNSNLEAAEKSDLIPISQNLLPPEPLLSQLKSPVLVPTLPVSGGVISPIPSPQIRNPLYPRYLQVPFKPPQEFQQQLQPADPSTDGKSLSIHEKVVEQELPHIHQQQNFIPEVTSEDKQENFDDLFSSILQPPIERKSWFGKKETNSDEDKEIDNFYHSAEFKKLMKEYNLPLNIKKLPDIREVMGLLGTTTLDDTVETLKDIASTEDGKEMIRDFLESDKSDVDYQEHSDETREGEILVSAGKYPESPQVLTYQNSKEQTFSKKFLSQFPKVAVPVHYILPHRNPRQPTEMLPEKNAETPPQKLSFWGRLKHWAKVFITGEPENPSTTETPKEILDKFPGKKIQSVFYYIPAEVDTVTPAPKYKTYSDIPGEIQGMFSGQKVQSVSYSIPSKSSMQAPIKGEGHENSGHAENDIPKEVKEMFPGEEFQSVTHVNPVEYSTAEHVPEILNSEEEKENGDPPEIPFQPVYLSALDSDITAYSTQEEKENEDPTEVTVEPEPIYPSEPDSIYLSDPDSDITADSTQEEKEKENPPEVTVEPEPIYLPEPDSVSQITADSTQDNNPSTSIVIPIDVRGGNIRRNFEVSSGPQRLSDVNFVPGKVHKANPDAIMAMIKTNPLKLDPEEERKVVEIVSTLTERHQKSII